MKRHPKIELLSSERLVRSKVFDVYREGLRLPSGLEQDLVVLDHPGAVSIAPVLDDGRLLLVRQYRHAIGDWLLELPAGRLERDEDPASAARRELEEETGYRAREWKELGRFYLAPGFCSERMVLYLARGLEAVPGGGLEADADEELELVRLSPDELLKQGPRDAKTWIAALLLQPSARASSS